MAKMIYINLPVADLALASHFYTAIGCSKNEQFSDQSSACMVWSDAITFQLLSREKFADFSAKPIADSHKTTAALLALTSASRAEVDAMAEAAAASGGRADVRAPVDLGWLYNRAFEDADGHVFEAIWMDMQAAAQ